MHSSDVPSSFADAVIMNFPLNHLNDNDALLSVKEVNAFPFTSSPACRVYCSARQHARMRDACQVWRVLKSGGVAFFGMQNRLSSAALTPAAPPEMHVHFACSPDYVTRFACFPKDGSLDVSPNGGSR